MRSKSRKIELSNHRTTEDGAEKGIINSQVNVWVQKLRTAEQGGLYGVNIPACADVLADLLHQINEDKIQAEVISGVMKRGNWFLSLEMVRTRAGYAWARKVKK